MPKQSETTLIARERLAALELRELYLDHLLYCGKGDHPFVIHGDKLILSHVPVEGWPENWKGACAGRNMLVHLTHQGCVLLMLDLLKCGKPTPMVFLGTRDVVRLSSREEVLSWSVDFLGLRPEDVYGPSAEG